MQNPDHDPVCDVLIRFKDREGNQIEVVLNDCPLGIQMRQNGGEPTILTDANAVAFVYKVSVQHLRYVSYIRQMRMENDARVTSTEVEQTIDKKERMH